jgi:hypothetical protein
MKTWVNNLETLPYDKLQIAKIIIGIPSYKTQENMSAKHKKHAIVASVLTFVGSHSAIASLLTHPAINCELIAKTC